MRLQMFLKEVLIQAAAFLTPVAIGLSFPEFAFFTGAVFIGLPFGIMLIASLPLFFVYLTRVAKEPLRNQLVCFCLLLGLITGCALVIMPRMEYFEYLLASMRR